MKLIDLIGKGDLKKVLEILAKESKGLDSDFVTDVTIQQQRVYRLLEKKRRGTEATNTLEVEWNRLTEDICDLVKEFENQYGEIYVSDVENTAKISNEYIPVVPKKSINLKILVLRIFIYAVFFAFLIYSFSIFINISRLFTPYTQNIVVPTNESKAIVNLPPITTFQEIGLDKNMKYAGIYIDILDSKFTWVKGEAVAGKYVYENKDIDLEEYFKEQIYIEKINQAKDIICIGNASFEENLQIPKEFRKTEEETRASARANHLKNIIRHLVLNGKTNVLSLNVGKYSIESPPSSNIQRSIVIVRVVDKEDGVNLKEAIIDALSKKNEMPFNIKNFTLVKDGTYELE